MDDPYFKKITTAVILAILIVLAFFLLKPILLSIIVGFILAFSFTPTYNWLNKYIKSKNICSFLICFSLILLIILPIWFLTPVLINQSVKFYLTFQEVDFITPLKNIFPSLFASEEFSIEIGFAIKSFVTNTTNSLVNLFSQLIFNFPNLFLQFLVAFFTFFFVLKDKEKVISYIKSLLPFSKDVEKKLFKSSKDITSSVIYGQIIIGVVQGIFAGLGFFIFGVPNALLLTLFAALAGIIPIIGPAIIWVPVAIYLFVTGDTFSALGIVIFGFFSSTVDNFLRPMFIAKRTMMHPALILIGMIGGFFLFGVLGFILGPLIIAYLLIILEIYRNKKIPGILIKQPQNKELDKYKNHFF
jgi:predicted PurR-regulated permease PerM